MSGTPHIPFLPFSLMALLAHRRRHRSAHVRQWQILYRLRGV